MNRQHTASTTMKKQKAQSTLMNTKMAPFDTCATDVADNANTAKKHGGRGAT